MTSQRILPFFTTLLLFFVLTAISHATLIDRGGGLIYDDHLDITWLQDANYESVPTINWHDAMNWVSGMQYYDSVRDVIYDDWRLPTALNQDGSGPCTGYNCTDSEMGHLYYSELGNTAGSGGFTSTGPFININPSATYWSSTSSTDQSFAIYFYFGAGDQHGGETMWDYREVWAVRDGDVATVPEPVSLLLLGVGFAGIAGMKSRNRQ